MNGGYIIISKTQADAYALSLKALELGKPILWYEDNTTCYYIDTISKSGTDIVLTKGGKTITIESDETITESGEIQTHLYRYAITLSDTNDDHYTILVNVNEKIDEDITDIKDLYKYFAVGDIVLDGDYNDSFTNWLAIYTDMNTHQFAGVKNNSGTLQFNDYGFDNSYNVIAINFIKQLF